MKNKYTVVIAEDEELLLENLIQKVNKTNLNFKIIATAQTGKHALELVKAHNPDLLITDIKMPIMTGIELIEQVRNLFPSVRSLIISGFSDFQYAKSALRYEVCDYLLKPIDIDELYNVLFKIQTALQLEQETYHEFFNITHTSNTPDQVAKLLHKYLIDHCMEKVNLTLIANNMNYNPVYLTKIFNDVYGTTPNKFLITLRIQHSQKLLANNPELSIGQIGELVSYPDPGYFSRIFKKQTGISPNDYRKNKEEEK